jgi:tetratricopeptide (TPR) repeat protein
VPAEKRDLLMAAGHAAYAALGHKPDARERFADAIAKFPQEPNLHYALGAYLMQEGEEHAEEALAEFRKEIEVNPKAVLPRLEIAFELIKRGEHAQALPYAEEAVRLAPELFAAHNAFGRTLVETGDVPRGVTELERAVALAPESPELRAGLARAYVMAGRPADAERERKVFQRLQVQRETRRLPGFAREDTLPRQRPEGKP